MSKCRKYSGSYTTLFINTSVEHRKLRMYVRLHIGCLAKRPCLYSSIIKIETCA